MAPHITLNLNVFNILLYVLKTSICVCGIPVKHMALLGRMKFTAILGLEEKRPYLDISDLYPPEKASHSHILLSCKFM